MEFQFELLFKKNVLVTRHYIQCHIFSTKMITCTARLWLNFALFFPPNKKLKVFLIHFVAAGKALLEIFRTTIIL